MRAKKNITAKLFTSFYQLSALRILFAALCLLRRGYLRMFLLSTFVLELAFFYARSPVATSSTSIFAYKCQIYDLMVPMRSAHSLNSGSCICKFLRLRYQLKLQSSNRMSCFLRHCS